MPGTMTDRPVKIPEEQVRKPKIFAADLPQGEDALGLEPLLQPLAELAIHPDAEAPLTIGLLGGAGSGKSFALAKLLARIETLSAVGASRDNDSSLSPIMTLRIDALGLSGEQPVVALAGALYDKLAITFPELAREAAQAVRDPQVVAREAAEQLDIGRRRLDTERQNLAEIESRRARLAETILFELPGSQVDTYARANRAKIESRLEGFGVKGDAIANYKSMVRDIADSGGASARIGAALRGFWAFKGQARLLVTAVILILFGLGCGWAVTHQDFWLAGLRAANQAFVPTATWFESHIGWLPIAGQVAFAGAALAVFTNFWRGVRFLRPLFRGVSLLEGDVAERRRDLDGLYAHQMRRVDALAADVELTGRRAAEADRRAASAGVARLDRQAEPSPFDAMTLKSQAERFFAAIASSIQHGWRGGEPVSAIPLPHRIIVGLDNIDCLPQPETHAFFDAVRRAFARPGFVTLIAADPRRLAAVTQMDDAGLDKWIQIPVRIGRELDEEQRAMLVAYVLGRTAHALMGARQESEAQADIARATSRSEPLDWSVSTEETGLLTALAPLAGQSPRAVKRFVNLYRIARAQVPECKAILAFMLALDQGGSASEIATVEKALATSESNAEFVLQPGSARLDVALAAVWANRNVTVDAARRAAAVAGTYSLRI